jgi:hypothetical protein
MNESEEQDQRHEDEYFEYLLEVGAFEIDGINVDGELMFKPNPEKMKEYAPEMFAIMQQDIEDSLIDLYKEGLVEIEYQEDLEPLFRMSEEGKKAMEQHGFYHIDES